MTLRSRNLIIRTAALGAVLSLATAANAYYHFVHFRGRTAPFQPIYEKFNLSALPAQTVPFFVSEQGPSQLSAGDSFSSLVSQIRLAARVWSEVDGSALQLRFGGLQPSGSQQSTPAVEVVFQELPPGVLAMGGPSVRGSIADGPDGPFVPIEKSTVVLPADFSQQSSWTEGFFLTLTHEFGHALGLQHSLTSSVMSTSITRATTKSKPLALDDIIGLSVLYPARNLQAFTGTIQGRVTVEGAAANMASVVALSLDGTAVSAITNPDGSYQIRGIPAGSYYVYAHPLPPAIVGEAYNAGINPPLDPDGRYLTSTGTFDTVFFPGTKEPQQAMVVSAGAAVEAVNFDLKRRQSTGVFGVQTFSFPGQVAVKPAHLSPEAARSFIVASGYGLTDKATVAVLGGSAVVPPGGVKPYPVDTRFLQIDTQFNLGSGEGPRHLTFSSDGDLYVLPSAFRLTRRLPPQVTTITPGFDPAGNRIAIVSGTGFTPETRILFDGVPALVRSRAGDSITVLAPATAQGQRTVVVALNGDGQSSLFLQAPAPPSAEYDSAEIGALQITPASIPAGAEAAIEILVGGTSLNAEYAAVALGSSGISVRDLWVTGPGRLVASVVAAPGAVPGGSTVTVLNGIRMLTLQLGFQTGVLNPRQSFIRGRITDPSTGRPGAPAGAQAMAQLAGPITDTPAAALRISVGELPATVLSFTGGQLLFRMPAGLPSGVAIVRVSSTSGETALPAAVQVDPPPPAITAVQVSGTRVDASRPAQPGEVIGLTVSGLAEGPAEVATGSVWVSVAGFLHPAVSVAPLNGAHVVQFVLDKGIPNGPQTVSVSVNGRSSEQVPLPVRR